MMTSLKIVIKRLNNSYESELSSGIGSSLSEHHDSAIYDEENMNFPIYQIVNNEANITSKHDDALQCDKINEEHDLNNKSRADSTQESSFEGFADSSFEQGMDQREIDEETNAELMSPQQLVVPSAVPDRVPEPATITTVVATTDISPGKLRFAKFFDVITEENSCNAVDVLLSSEKAEIQSANVGSVHSNETSSELSFNGRIKRLTSESPSTSQQTAPIQQPLTIAGQRLPTLLESSINDPDLMESSFVLKKYTNEKSPDLFGDEDDDEKEDDNDENNEDNKNEENNIGNHGNRCQEKPKLFTYEEIIEGDQKELHQAAYNNNQDTNFVDEQTTMEANNANNQMSDSLNLFRANCKRERELLRRTRSCLAGIPPPPTMTIPQMDVMTAVLSRKEDILNFHKTELRPELPLENTDSCSTQSLFKPTHTLEETQSMAWKDILGVRQHGLSFNLSKASERNEDLSLSVIDRFVGSETASSYQVYISSAKKRSERLKMLTASPGSRLSHLAKRRTVFSSANLATNLQKSNSSLGTQILLDKKKIRNRRKATPKRKTPASKKKNVRKTPSSSARKRLYRCDIIKPGPSRETSKRALFQSPAKKSQLPGFLPKPIVIKPEIATRVEKSKRALFASDKQSSLFDAETLSQQSELSSVTQTSTATSSQQLESLLLKRKRNVCADDDDVAELAQNNKMFRGNGSQNLTPRALKIKSQSFCIGAGSSTTSLKNYQESTRNETSEATLATSYSRNLLNSSQLLLQNRTSSSNSSIMTVGNCKLFRAQSENTTQIMSTNSLTENQRKKLLWAVSEALKEKKISAKHESFKEYASVLARVVRRIFQEYYQKGSTSNSETMLRLAKKYVYNVISNRNVDDIYFHAKAQIDEDKRKSSNRLAGYITSEEYENRKVSQQRQAQLSQTLSQRSFLGGGSLQNLFGIDSSMDSSFSMNISQVSSVAPASNATFSGLIATETSAKDIQRTQEEQIKSISAFGALLQHSQEVYQQQQQHQILKHPPIQPNPTLQNSSSKNNLCGLALRENVDCDQRRSAQKNFTGKDQRNVSPYAVVASNRSALKVHSTVKHDLFGVNAAASKAKRQISFDS